MVSEKSLFLISEFFAAFNPPAIAFDGCHKIYIALDDDQVRIFEGYGYNEDTSSMVYAAVSTRDEMISTLKKWYADSCPLRFISAVKTVKGDPNDGFISIISQFEDQEEE